MLGALCPPAGIITDWDLCLRMWTAGWQVMAAKQVQMTHDKEEGGTHKPETAERCWGKQQGITLKVLEVSCHETCLLFTHGKWLEGHGRIALLTGVLTADGPLFQSHNNPEFERELCGVARELSLKNLKLIDPSK